MLSSFLSGIEADAAKPSRDDLGHLFKKSPKPRPKARKPPKAAAAEAAAPSAPPAAAAAAPAPPAEDKDKDHRTVFVANIPVSLLQRRKVVVAHFAQFGAVESVRFRSIPIASTAVPSSSDYKVMRRVASRKGNLSEAAESCNAYVVFKDPKGSESAIASGSGTKLEGHTLRVDRLREDGGGEIFDRRRTVFVGNLPFTASDEAVRAFFAAVLGAESDDEEEAESIGGGLSPVEGVRIIRDRATNIGKGIAYVLLRTTKLAEKALEADGTVMERRKLRVSKAERSRGMKKRRKDSGFEGARSEHPASKRIRRSKGDKAKKKAKSKSKKQRKQRKQKKRA